MKVSIVYDEYNGGLLLGTNDSLSVGYIVQGVFKCRKSDDNSRELDVEIHYSVRESAEEEAGDLIVQTFKVR